MACFIVPAGEAVVTMMVEKGVESKEVAHADGRISWKQKLSWLNTMLWGGSALLALEHIWHGEVTFTFPFLTAMNNAADTAVMLQEMSTVGVGMAVMVTAAWAVMCLVADHVPAARRAFVPAGQEA